MVETLTRRARLIALAQSWRGPQGATPRPKPRTPRGIEDLLVWAYGQELPKMARQSPGLDKIASSWEAVDRFFDELSLAGPGENQFGVVPDWQAFEAPHADAIAVHEAVGRLDERLLGLPEGWSPLEDLGDLDGHARPLAVKALAQMNYRDGEDATTLRRTPRRLIVRHAILGGCPDWRIDRPAIKPVTDHGMVKWFMRQTVTIGVDPFGKPLLKEVEVDGFDHRRRMPRREAYTKTFLDPDPLPGVISRAEYEIWRAALDVLVEELRGKLSEYEAVASAQPPRPWECAFDDIGPRVLDDLSAPQIERGAKRRRRALA